MSDKRVMTYLESNLVARLLLRVKSRFFCLSLQKRLEEVEQADRPRTTRVSFVNRHNMDLLFAAAQEEWTSALLQINKLEEAER